MSCFHRAIHCRLSRKFLDLLGLHSAWIVIPEFKAIQVLLPNDEKHYFDNGICTDPATGIQVPIEQVFQDLL